MNIFEGVGVAIVTPFKNNKIDYVALKNLIEKDILEGANAIIVLGTTGESATITQKERTEIIKFCKTEIKKRAKLIVGTGNNNFKTCLKNTKDAKLLGADACLVVTPYYNKTTQQGLIKYYQELNKVGIPIIAYNVPSRTGLNIELSTIKELVKNHYICGIKESTTDITRIMELTRICKNKIAVYSGEDDLNFVFYCLGANGTISVTANILTSYVKKLFDCVKSGNLFQALKIQNKLTDINKILFVETNPIPIKAVLSKLNLINNELRLPLVTLSKENESLIDKIVQQIKSLGK